MQTLVSNRKRKKLLEYLLANAGEKILVRRVASKLGLNAGFVSVFVSKLKRKGIVKGGTVNLGSAQARLWKIVFNINAVEKIAGEIMRSSSALGVGVYGSWVKGTNTEKSDLDLWVKVKKLPGALEAARLRAQVRKKLGVEPSILFLTGEKITQMKKDNPPMYFSLVHSFVLRGEGVD
ncbi:nucleotidyltransferase domain-containing protein [Candidatus Micrarchaeota archaeon]|nr:nucleotidyltransferase domain-containing protein [Candidatus Micrarchaeota archaeon]